MSQIKWSRYFCIKTLTRMNGPFQYVNGEDIPNELLCDYCGDPLIEPTEHQIDESSVCPQIYCKSCIEFLVSCVHCKAIIKDWKLIPATPVSQRFLFKPLEELEVCCCQCDCTCKRGKLKEHLKGCPIGKRY